MKPPNKLQDPPRWLGDGAPPALEAMVRADSAAELGVERVGRVADGIARELGRPALAEMLRAEHAASASVGGVGLSWVKLLLGVSLIGTLAVGAFLGMRSAGPPDTLPQAAAVPASPAAARPPDPVESPAVSIPPVATAPPAPPVPPTAPAARETRGAGRQTAAAATVDRSTPPTGEADSVAELALLARAQRALRRDPAAALKLAREHKERFGGGNFVQEREMIAIEALFALEDRARALRRGKRFLRAYPSSSHAPRLRELLASGDPLDSAQ